MYICHVMNKVKMRMGRKGKSGDYLASCMKMTLLLLECEIHRDGMQLEYMLEFKFLGCFLDDPVVDEVECCRNMMSGRRVAVAIKSLCGESGE